MLENLLFCLRATMPIFLMMILGYLFKRADIISDSFAKNLNSFVFKIALPVLVYKELATADIKDMWDTSFVIYCFLCTVLSIFIGYLLSRPFKDSSTQAEFIQASFRSSAALLGVGIVTNLYGNAGLVPIMIIGAVPLYNITAVVVLTLGHENGKLTKDTILKTLKGVITNPIILGIVFGLIRSLIPVKILLPTTIDYIAALATPLGLLALGASFDISAALDRSKPAIIATILKLIVHPLYILPLSIYLGYGTDKLVALLIMAGSPTTVSCYVMAKSMGHPGVVSASTVMLTTFFSAFSLTLWLYILRTLGLI